MHITEAWEYWEETPNDPKSVANKEDALREEAIRMGKVPSELHDEITRLRGFGLTVKQAWEQIEMDYDLEWLLRNA